MSEGELLDIVNEKGEIIGTAPRSEAHSNPKLIHRVVHCWILNSNAQILWQQRSLSKKQSPGKWDMSFGGHVVSKDEPEQTLKRELEEELGIKDAQPIFVESYIKGDSDQTEMIYLYYLINDEPEENFVLQKEEVEKVQWIDVNQAMLEVVEGRRESTNWLFDQVPRIFKKVFKEKP